jgi:RimJ/RimL family protein N-acetyltransferase
MHYIFQSARLGFRNWITADIDKMAQINADSTVMEFFPAVSTKQQTIDFIKRMQLQFSQKGFCYFAVDKLIEQEFIGFIGLSEQTYPAAFTPCIDIGWRISSNEWNKGFATEGAQRCLAYAFNDLKIDKVYAVAPIINTRSIHIMTKVGMVKQYEFDHPLLNDDERLRKCVLFEKRTTDGTP